MPRSSTGARSSLRAAAERVRHTFFEDTLTRAWREGRRICVLDWEGFAEGSALAGRDLSNVTLVVRHATEKTAATARHGSELVIEVATPKSFLNRTVRLGERFDLIYAMALADRLDDSRLEELVEIAIEALLPKGEMLIGNLAPGPVIGDLGEAKAGPFLHPRSPLQLAGLACPELCVVKVWSDLANSISFAKFERI